MVNDLIVYNIMATKVVVFGKMEYTACALLQILMEKSKTFLENL
jgi:hypothetical protein